MFFDHGGAVSTMAVRRMAVRVMMRSNLAANEDVEAEAMVSVGSMVMPVMTDAVFVMGAVLRIGRMARDGRHR